MTTINLLNKKKRILKTLTAEEKIRARFFRDKAVWRRRVKRVVRLADDISQSHLQGDYISMGVLYESGRQIFTAGERGVLLRHRMDDYGVIQRDKVHESIASTCKLLQSASEVVQKIAEKQGTALVDFPLFESPLAATSKQELGAQNALKSLMDDIDLRDTNIDLADVDINESAPDGWEA